MALTRDGLHVANLEYARCGMPGGGWPGTGTTVLDTSIPESAGAGWLAGRKPREVVRSHEVGDAGHADLIDPDHVAYLLLLAEIEELARG